VPPFWSRADDFLDAHHAHASLNTYTLSISHASTTFRKEGTPMPFMRIVTFLVAVFIPALAWSQAAIITVPPDNFDVEGNTSLLGPFASEDRGFCNHGSHFQQVYANFDIGGPFINGMSFRQDGATAAPASFTIPNVVVTISHTDAAVGTYGGTFAQNLQPGATVVFAGDLVINSLPVKGGGGGPAPFDVDIPFHTDFEVTSEQNILVDITLPDDSCIEDLELDAQDDCCMGLQGTDDLAEADGSSVAQLNNFGLVTQFFISGPGLIFNAGGFSGSWWFGPTHDGEGLLIEIIDIGGVPFILVYWFTFDALGNQMWLVGIVEFTGFGPTVLNMERLVGPVFGPGFDPGDVVRIPFGTITIDFLTEDTGTMDYASPAFGAGSYDISRITSIFGNPGVDGSVKAVQRERSAD